MIGEKLPPDVKSGDRGCLQTTSSVTVVVSQSINKQGSGGISLSLKHPDNRVVRKSIMNKPIFFILEDWKLARAA
jgi:hypothetical protein